MDAKFGLVLLITSLLGYEANWSSVGCAFAGGAIAVIYFWKFLQLHRSFIFLIAGLTIFLMAINLFGATNWINNILVLICPSVAIFLIQYKYQSNKVVI